MLPSSTVENYLKAIFQAQSAVPKGGLVPMGQVAARLGVVPGTATTMVKALADAGLAHYEPYTGVRLTPSGQKLAALVLRRHRLVEQFLVEVMGMSWTEVHAEAEKLEHVVSERLIELMDKMLGHPEVDPHGDPIPGPEGEVKPLTYDSLANCPLGTPVTVTRVADQDAEFLKFVEEQGLRPGQPLEVEARDAAADSVQVRGKDGRRITIGSRAASKLLVKAALAVLLLLLVASVGSAQPAKTGSGRPFEILDNSFFIEEAFNQEPGIFQNIFGFVRLDGGSWAAAFTQEWPAPSQRHQLSYTVPFLGGFGASGVGDILINYRHQAFEESATRPAFSPRFSLVLPTGDEDDQLGTGVFGFLINLPFSKQRNDLYFHWNVGLSVLPGVKTGLADLTIAPASADEVSLVTPLLGGSVIWRVRPLVNLMFESLASFNEQVVSPGRTTRDTKWIFSPGVRVGHNIGDRQLVFGTAIPIGLTEETEDWGVFVYFSYELPFKRN